MKLKEEFKTAKIYGKAAKGGVIDLSGASTELLEQLSKNKDLAFLFEGEEIKPIKRGRKPKNIE